MITLLKQKNRFNETILLALLSVACLVIWVIRKQITGYSTYLFLTWNLFLAFVPWALSSIAMIWPRIQRRWISIVFLAGSWLLFFPNAPYILTDLMHLKSHSWNFIWFDLILILAFAWTGLLYGFFSLRDLEEILRARLNVRWINILMVAFLFVTSFGVYVGRYLRWNSWDILREPLAILYDVWDRLSNPTDHPRAWGMTILIGVLLNMMYWSLKLIRKKTVIK